MEEPDEAQQQNMVSNLPLLFANGYPTSLDKISEKALETFIPFMVQCSLGNINIQGRSDISEPEWWPEDVPFSIPLVKPKKFEGNWLDKMKEIVVICYQFHKSIFLLRFCYDLAAYEPTRLRFMNNYNSTTSLYDRRCNKLLVTFRNENMSYDQPQRNRKTLLQKSRSQTSENNNNTQQMVEPALFDIYLCDHCDAELYSLEAITEHEKTCIQDDDVIICESPSPEDDDRIAEQNVTNLLDKSNDERREAFLLNFALQSRNIPPPEKSIKLDSSQNQSIKSEEKITTIASKTATSRNNGDRFKCVSIASRRSGRNASNDGKTERSPEKLEKLKRLPRRNRAVYALSRCPTVPLSSPAGQLMIKSSKTLMTNDYLYERLDRMERFCHTPILSPGVIRPKFMSRKFVLPHTPVTHKKPVGPPIVRLYSFPRRQFFNRYRVESFLFLNSLLLKQCRPVSIRLKKLNEACYDRRGSSYFLSKSLGLSRCSNRSNSSASSDCLSIKSSHVAESRSAGVKRTPEVVVDTIDLCSSDEDDHDNDGAGKEVTIPEVHQKDDAIKIVAVTSQAQIFSSEITLTPLSKSLEKEIEDIRNKSKFEGNFLVSQSTATQPPKPLQPSVFLFSNYTTENIHLRHSTGGINSGNTTNYNNSTGESIIANGCHQSTPPPQLEKRSSQPVFQFKSIAKDFSNSLQNQENVERNTTAPIRSTPTTTIIKSSSLNTLQNGGNDWLPNLNVNHRTDRCSNPTTTSNGSSNKIIQILKCSSEDSDVVLNKINSPPPNRTISIDLTI